MSLEIFTGDAVARLRELPADSVHCVVTSPPYWGLRDYGTGEWEGGDPACDHKAPNRFDYAIADKQASHGGSSTIACYRDICGKCGARRVDQQIGLEATPEEWAARLVEVFREVKRVLRSDGTFWLNVGDSYAANQTNNGGYSDKSTLAGFSNPNTKGRRMLEATEPRKVAHGVKAKDLIGQPWLLAFALRADGWYLRSEIIWSKPNPMPESVRDRPTKAHEQVFLLTKSGETTYWVHRDLPGTRTRPEPDYRWVHKATGEEIADDPGDLENWQRINLWSGRDYFYDQEAVREDSSPSAVARAGIMRKPSPKEMASVEAGHWNGAPGSCGKEYGIGRNMRSVWTIATEPFAEAHFATFPTALARRCILAGTSAKGCCPECGAPWQRVVERRFEPQDDVSAELGVRGHDGQKPMVNGSGWQGFPRGTTNAETTGWAQTCGCNAGEPVPATVLDCFGGSGTAGLVAEQLCRNAILIELNPQYAEMARCRIDHARARRSIGDVTERFQPLPGQQELPL